MDHDGSDAIDQDEVENHLKYISAAMDCETREERAAPLSEGLVLFGGRFIESLAYINEQAEGAPLFQELFDQSVDLLGMWLTGASLTKRADENDRRALVAYDLLDMGGPAEGLKRLAAAAILKLPTNHPLRDQRLAYQALLEYLEKSRDDQAADNQLYAYSALLKYKLEPEGDSLARIQAGLALIGSTDDQDSRHDFLVEALGFYLQGAIAARDADQKQQMDEQVAEALRLWELLDRVDASGQLDPAAWIAHGLILEVSEDLEGAVESYSRVRQIAGVENSRGRLAAFREGFLRLQLGQDREGMELLSSLLAGYETDYLTAVDDDEVHQAGADFTELLVGCAVSAVKLEDWPAAIHFIERSKSPRMRYRAALRQSPLGNRFLELETLLYAVSRGVPLPKGSPIDMAADRLGDRVTVEAQLMETYRELRATLPPSSLGPPSIAAVAAALAPDEAAVLFGFTFDMTWLAVICPGDSDRPSWTWVTEALNKQRWQEILLGGQMDGWGYAIAAPELEMDRPESLDKMLAALDGEIGRPLGERLGSRQKIRRLTLVPHSILHLIPLWAMPSLAGYEVLVAPSAAHMLQARQPARPAGKHALAISNPTLDLPLSPAEVESLRCHLEPLDVPVQVLHGQAANQAAIQKELNGCALLHFCGHGLAELMNPAASGLLVSPVLEETNLPLDETGPDPLAWAARQVSEWHNQDDEIRWGGLPGLGRIVENRPETGTLWTRRLEYSPGGTLLGDYKEDRLVRLAEIWTAGDIMVEDRLAGVRFAFLSACASGSGAMEFAIDEYSGLPAALQLAGVPSVVASLWPVSDVMTALYVDLFYEALAAAAGPHRENRIDIPGLVYSVGSRLRAMPRAAAADHLRRVRSRVSDGRARFRLEAYIDRLAGGEEFPFHRPYDWAAFYAIGAPTIRLAGD